MWWRSDISQKWPLIIAGLFGILIQIQVTFGRGTDSLGLTLNLADFLLPFLGVGILYTLLYRRSTWPRWQDRWTDVMIVVLTGCFLFSAGYAYYMSGNLSPWAIVNRLLGWGVVIGYFYLGGWALTRYGDKAFSIFIQSFAFGCLFFAFVEGAGIILGDIAPSMKFSAYPLDGGMGNRNAFAFLFMVAYGALAAVHRHTPHAITHWLLIGFHSLLPFFFFLNGSRVLFLLIPVMYVAVFFLLRRSVGIRFLLVPFLIGGIFFGGISIRTGETLRESQLQRVQLETIADPTVKKLHTSDRARAVVNHDAWERFQENPVFGMGLGQFLVWQKEHYGHLIDLIDSIPLWILTEMGCVGLLLFFVFGVRMIRAVFLKRPHSGVISDAAFFTIFVFLAMGAVHQLFYARAFWLILGAAVAFQASALDKSFLSPKNSLP